MTHLFLVAHQSVPWLDTVEWSKSDIAAGFFALGFGVGSILVQMIHSK